MFRVYAAKLTKFAEKYSNIVVCPLCRREFNYENMALLSRDHIIPEALGGKVVTVTCRRCNNSFGHQAESHLSKPFHLARLYETEKGLVGKLSVGEDKFAAVVKKAQKPGVGLQIATLGGPPDAFARLEQSLNKSVAFDLNFTHQVHYRSDRAITAIVKAAHLAAFRDSDYRYVFSDAGEMIRTELVAAKDGRSDLLRPLVGSLARVDALTGSEPDFAILRVEIDEHRFTFALLLFRSGTNGYWTFVLLPDVDGYPEGTFAVGTIFQYLEEAKRLLGPYHVQMQGDGTGVTAFRLFNPTENITSETVYILPK